MNIETLKGTGVAFAKKFAAVFAFVLLVHVLILLGLSYIHMEFLVVSGLNFVEWGAIWRAVSLVPYLILPLGVASFQTFAEYKPRFKLQTTNDGGEWEEVDTYGK